MASVSIRSIFRASLSSLRSNIPRYKASEAAVCLLPSSTTGTFSRSSILRFPAFSRCPVELGCFSGTLFPLHVTVVAARFTSRLSLSTRSFWDLSHDIFDGS